MPNFEFMHAAAQRCLQHCIILAAW